MIPYFSVEQIDLGFLSLHTWGLLVGMGFVAGAWYTLGVVRERGFDENKILNLILVIFISSFIGARLLYALQFGFAYFEDGEIFRVWDGGLMLYGGIAGAFLGSLLYIYFSYPLTISNSPSNLPLSNEKILEGQKQGIWGKIYHNGFFMETLKVADLLAPGIALGLVVGRIGCFFVNDHAGALTQVSWAIKFPDGMLRHPVILYLIVSNVALFGLLRLLRNRLQHVGTLFMVFILWYSVSRLILDFFRAADQSSLSDPRFFNLTSSQILSMGILIFALLVVNLKKPNKETVK